MPQLQDSRIVFRAPNTLRINPRNVRVHSKRQVRQIANSIKEFGHLVPIIIDETGMILSGHGRRAAAMMRELPAVPTITVAGLSEAQKRAFAIADNKLTENAGWARDELAKEFVDLAELLKPIDLDLTITGFAPAEIDIILTDLGPSKADPGDLTPSLSTDVVTRRGDVWTLDKHRVLCGDARSRSDVDRLMEGTRARMVFTDPPYNRVIGQVGGRGRIKHADFAFASGEMTAEQYIAFLTASFRNLALACEAGAIAFICIDWRHMREMQEAGGVAFAEFKNLVVWNKTSPGQGSFYRSQHELIFVFKVSPGEHVNAFGLGKHGRTRSNVWTYPGANTFRTGRMDDLTAHPTVKPVALVADAMRDCSLKGDIVLDVFLGAGTTILAAEKVGRRSFGIEYEPGYVDVTIRRWQRYTKNDAILVGDGRTFDEIAAERLATSGKEAGVPEDKPRSPAEHSGEPAGDWIRLCGPCVPIALSQEECGQ